MDVTTANYAWGDDGSGHYMAADTALYHIRLVQKAWDSKRRKETIMHWYARARGVHRVVLGLLIVLLSVVSLPLSHAQESQGLGLAVVSVGTTVRDMDRALAFYWDVLEFEPRFDVEITALWWYAISTRVWPFTSVWDSR